MKSRMDYLITDLCGEIDFLREKLAEAKEEAKHCTQAYNSLLSHSLSHSQTMMHNVMSILLTEGVAEKFVEGKE